MSKWVILCPACGEEFKVDEEVVPARCPHCEYEGDFEVVGADD